MFVELCFDKDLNLGDQMKKLILPFMIAIVGSLVAGCAPPAANTNVANTANVNANRRSQVLQPYKRSVARAGQKSDEAWDERRTQPFRRNAFRTNSSDT
jgi:hypothetical protein